VAFALSNGARELNKQAIAHRLNDATTMFIDRRVDQDTPKFLQAGKGALLIQAD
jgi:hypothetical protein